LMAANPFAVVPPALPPRVFATVRATLFANRAIGVGVMKPSGFGRITTRVPGGGGSRYSSGRSGSFGRGYSSYG